MKMELKPIYDLGQDSDKIIAWHVDAECLGPKGMLFATKQDAIKKIMQIAVTLEMFLKREEKL